MFQTVRGLKVASGQLFRVGNCSNKMRSFDSKKIRKEKMMVVDKIKSILKIDITSRTLATMQRSENSRQEN